MHQSQMPRSVALRRLPAGLPPIASGLLLAAFALAACAVPTPTAAPTPVPAIPPTGGPTAAPPPAEPPPTATLPPAPKSPYYPPDTRTGIAVVDSVIEAMLAGDQAALVRLVHYTNTFCTHADGLGGPPKCAADQAEGAEVEVFPVLGPEGSFLTRETIANAFPPGDYALHSVYRVADDPYEFPFWPAGEYGVVFADQATGTGLILLVEENGIVRSVYTFPGQDLLGRDVGEFVLPPKTQPGASLDVPQARVTVMFSGPGRFVQSQEANRRGSFVSYDFVPETYEPPYLQEIQFFSAESIGAFNDACQASGGPCFFGDYPDLDRYYRQMTSYMAGADVEGSDRLSLAGRAYYVTNRPCEGDSCVIREYTTFAGDVKIDVWVLMGAASQAQAADQIVRGLILKEY